MSNKYLTSQRNILREVELEIKEIAKSESPYLYTKTGLHKKSRYLEDLLLRRREILNDLFVPSSANLKRLERVNEYLNNLTIKLHQRVSQMASKKSEWYDQPDFDDSYNLEGTLMFQYNEEDSVLKLEDDGYYGSDFSAIIEIIAEFHNRYSPAIQQFYPDSELLDDGKSWNEYPFHGKEYDNLTICHAVHDICDHKLYSIPDLLRLNDFWAEVKLTVQSITDQKGFRFKDID